MAMEKAVGQWLTNIRRPGGLAVVSRQHVDELPDGTSV
jgi:hypothetical protein